VGQSVSSLTFPRDEGRHPYAEREWWYFKGHAQAEDGSHYSFVLCYFAPLTLQAYFLSIGAQNYFFSVIDEDKRLCYRAYYGVKGKASRCRCSEHRLDLSYGPNWWRQGEEIFTYLMHNEVPGDVPISLDLFMKALKPPLLINGTGMVDFPGGHSYYYAQTNLDIKGDLTIGNETKHVNGVGWIDRQWGRWEWGLISGWEWFGIHLNRNTEASVWFLLHPITREYRPWLFNMILNDSMSMLNAFEVRPLGYWKSKSGCFYPSGWRIIAPEKRIKLTIEPLLKDHEIFKGLREAACTVKGTFEGRQVSGRAIAECAYSVSSPFVRVPYYIAIKFLSRLRMLSLVRSLLRKPMSRNNSSLAYF